MVPDLSTIPTEHIEINGLMLAHTVHGDGMPVLLLHGWGVDRSLLWPLVERLAGMGYRCYAPDMPGFGASPPPPEAWTIFDYAQFVTAYMDHLDLEQAFLFGHSFGGRLGLVLGAEHASRLQKIVLADAAGVRAPASLTARLRLKLYKSIRSGLTTAGMGSIAERLRTWYNKRYGSADFQNTSGIMRETFIKVIGEDLQPYAARVRVPTLLIWGDMDQDTPLWQGQRLEALIPDAGLVVYPGAGHYSYLENLPQTVRTIDYFFRQT